MLLLLALMLCHGWGGACPGVDGDDDRAGAGRRHDDRRSSPRDLFPSEKTNSQTGGGLLPTYFGYLGVTGWNHPTSPHTTLTMGGII